MPGSAGGRRAVWALVGSRGGLAAAVGGAGAVLALGVVLGGGPGWVATLAWLIGAGYVALDLLDHREDHGGGYGRGLPVRAALFVAAFVAAAVHSPDQRGWIWAGAVVVLVAVLVEPLALRALPRHEVANLPGFRDAAGARFVGVLAPAAFAVIALAGLLGLVDVPALSRLVVPLAALVVLGVASVIGLANARDRSAFRARLHDALERYEPTFGVYTGRDDGGTYQVAMWLPYLARLDRPYVIITRQPSAVYALARITSAPVVARGAWRDLDDVIVPSLGAMFYVNSVANNSNVVGYRRLTHVYLGHGDSDKPLSHHPAHAMYDQVFVAGPAAVDRYARNGVAMRPEAFVIVGRPQLAALTAVRPGEDHAHGAAPTVLYAPTWVGYNSASTHSSLSRGVDVVRALLARGGVVIFRPHPFSRTRAGEAEQAAAIDAALQADASRTGRPHRWGPAVDDQSFLDTANDSDAMVADMSSVLVDYLATDKPFAVVAVGEPDAEEFMTRHPVARGAYLIDADLTDLTPALDRMLGADPLRTQRAATREYYLGGLDGPAAVAAFTAAAEAAISSS